MKLFKRGMSVALALALALPVFFAGEAQALTTSNYVPESNNPFWQDTNADEIVNLPTAFRSDGDNGSIDAIGNITSGGSMPVSSGDNASWAYAAIALLNAQGKGPFSLADLATATTRSAGNRSMVAAYLMRGTKAGPVKGSTGISESAITKNEKPLEPVSGIVYIPDLKVTAGTIARDIYISRLKAAVRDYGAVAASMYFSDSYLYRTEEGLEQTILVYDNNSAVTGAMASKAPDHTVVIVGWDDDFETEYDFPITKVTDGVTQTEYEKKTVTGAFLVYDSLGEGDSQMRGDAYWVSYKTLLSGAYYIKGFLEPFDVLSQRKDSSNNDIEKNPLATTYEYDVNGQSGVKAVSGRTAYYANVFDLKDGASALHAVSFFLTGEDNNYEVYLISDYKKTDKIDSLKDSGNWELVASGKESLPGYYTVPLESDPGQSGSSREAKIIRGKKFAVVVVNTSVEKGSAPVQISGASTKAGQGFYSSDGVTWTDAGSAAVSVKAHAERDIDIELESITILDAEGLVVGPGTNNPLEVAPGGTYTLGPTMIPATANDILYGLNKWTAVLPYYERDRDSGWLLAVKNDTGEWVAATEGPDGTLTALGEGLPSSEELAWNNNFALFLPADDFKLNAPTKPDGWKPNLALPDGETKPVVVTNYIEQPISLSNPGSSSALASLKVSKEPVYFEKKEDGSDPDPISLTVSVTRGKKDANGKWLGTSPDYMPVPSNEGGEKTHSFLVQIEADGVSTVELSRTSHTLKAGSSVTLSAKQLNKDGGNAPERTVTWKVAESYTTVTTTPDGETPVEGNVYTFFADYNPEDPYNQDGPVAIVDKDGKVTALRDGTCYIYAIAGGVESAPCKITVTKVAPTGISLSKKKYTVSEKTELTLSANVKPSSASNKRVTWSSSNTAVATVDEITGIITTISAGETKIIATTSTGGFKAECVLTVTEAPSIIKFGKTVTFSVLGAASKDRVIWKFTDANTNADGTEVLNSANESILSGTQSGAKFKVKSNSVGSGFLTAEVKATAPNGEDVTIRKQSWDIESVVPISKMEFRNAGDELVKKLTLSVDKAGQYGQEEILTVRLVKPADATLLDFTWTSKPDKATKKDMVEIEEVSENENGEVTIKIKALRAGSTKITGVNHNGKKKINISVKIFYYPTASQITVKNKSVTVVPGKKANLKGKVSDKTANKELRYSLYDNEGKLVSGWDAENGVYVEDDPETPAYLEMKKGKQTGKVITSSLPDGEEKDVFYLEIMGTPFVSGSSVTAGKVRVTVNLVPKQKR